MTKNFERIFVPAMFCIYLLVGVFIHSDYGVSWDEPISRTNGLVNLKYVESRFAPNVLTDEIKRQPDLANWPDKDYGVAFELPLVALEQTFGISEEGLYPFRHLVVFLFSALGVLAVYKTAKFVYRDCRLGLLAGLMIILSPRIFAESFYNSKDIVFMAAIAMAIYTLTRLITTPKIDLAILHGAISGFAIDVRIMGVLIVAVTVGILLVRAIKKEVPRSQSVACVLTFLAVTTIFVIALFPFLWEDPIGNFRVAFGNMATFRWHNWVLYLGRTHLASNLPWHYIPVWILITTPLVFSALMVVGWVHGVKTLLTSRFALWNSDVQMAELSYLALLFFPVLAIIVMHAVVYDGWRHLYFVYPAFVLVAVGGFVSLMDRARNAGRLRAVIVGIVVITFCGNLYWIIQSHPLQNVYFNPLAGRDWKDRFDLDYWGMANREAMEFVRDNENGRAITIKANSMTPLDTALLSMRRKDRDRFLLSSRKSKPEFVLTNYRLKNFFKDEFDPNSYNLYYQKKVDGELVVSVFKIRDASQIHTVSTIGHAYSVEEFRHLSYYVVRRYERGNQTYVDLKIENAGSEPIAAASSVGEPIRASWRFADIHGSPLDGWNARVDLPADIPAHGEITVGIPIDVKKAVAGGLLQVSLVQEGVFWAHDIGIPPATMPWANQDT